MIDGLMNPVSSIMAMVVAALEPRTATTIAIISRTLS
jgi:hypothetical protein